MLGFCGLGAKLSERAGNLSGGQQKLLELARVLMIEPKMILLDEPAAGVNPTLMETLVDKILALHKQGITFLIIEHNMDLVMRICSPIIVMAQGKVIFKVKRETFSATHAYWTRTWEISPHERAYYSSLKTSWRDTCQACPLCRVYRQP